MQDWQIGVALASQVKQNYGHFMHVVIAVDVKFRYVCYD